MPDRRKPVPTIDQRDPDPEEIVRVFKRYASLSSRLYGESIIALVACPACHADVDQPCVGGKNSTGESYTSLHADRRCAAERWRKKNPSEWVALKDAMFLHLVRMQRSGEI